MFLVKKKVNVMMGFPEKLKIGLLGWGGEYMNHQEVKKVRQKYQVSVLQLYVNFKCIT